MLIFFFSLESRIFISFWSASPLKKASWHNAGVLTSRDARFSLWLKQYLNVHWLVEPCWLRPIALQQNGHFLKRTIYPGLSGVAIRIRSPSLFYQKHIYAEYKVKLNMATWFWKRYFEIVNIVTCLLCLWRREWPFGWLGLISHHPKILKCQIWIKFISSFQLGCAKNKT